MLFALRSVMVLDLYRSPNTLITSPPKSVRDTPDSLPSFVGENEAKKGYAISQMGDNVFAAIL